MLVTSIASLKASLSECLAGVKAGEEVEVTDRERPVARIVPYDPGGAELDEFVRAGRLRRSRGPLPPGFWTRVRPADPEGRLLRAILDDREMIVWWASPVQCGSAVHRLRREGAFVAEDVAATALRLLAVHPLRAGDALQLAAALVWAQASRPGGREFVFLDDRLRTAATRRSSHVATVRGQQPAAARRRDRHVAAGTRTSRGTSRCTVVQGDVRSPVRHGFAYTRRPAPWPRLSTP